MHAVDVLICAAAVSCAVIAILAYIDLPDRAPMYTGFNGRSSREVVPKIAYLVGIVPCTLLTLVFTLSAIANAHETLAPKVQVAETVGDLLVLCLAWWGAAMVWSIGETVRGQRHQVPRLVMPFGAYAIVAVIGGGIIAYTVAR